jgi:secreted repeat protein with Y-X4-D motif
VGAVLPAGSKAPATMPGKFGEIVPQDGTAQLTYDGAPLHMFANDKTPGDNGEGVVSAWRAVTVPGMSLSGRCRRPGFVASRPHCSHAAGTCGYLSQFGYRRARERHRAVAYPHVLTLCWHRAPND